MYLSFMENSVQYVMWFINKSTDIFDNKHAV